MNRFRIVLVDHEWESLDIEQEMFSRQTSIPLEFIYRPCKTEAELIAATADADAVIVMYANITRNVVEQMKHTKIITRYGVGVNMIDVAAATEKGIYVGNVADYCMDEVSDHALSFILAQSRRLFHYQAHISQGGWDFKAAPIPTRANKTKVGLIGFGNIPRRLAQKLIAIGYQVSSYDPYQPDDLIRAEGVTPLSLTELLQESDFVSVHVPLVDATHHLISAKELGLMKKGGFLVNTARGPIIDENALVEALENGQIAGAALDVTETEPLPENHPFRRLPNVALTPHAAWYSEDALKEIRTKACQNILDMLETGVPKYLVNRELIKA